MDSLSPARRAYYNYLSRAYSVMYALNQRSFLGIRLSSLARWLPVFLFLIGLIQNWPRPWLFILLALTVWVNYSLWRARRDNYNRFVPDGSFIAKGMDNARPLPPNEKLTVQATGLFSVSGREAKLLLCPADYWRVPLGEHIVMAEERPGKFLYQFFNAQSLQTIQPGWLLFGAQPVESLAITFLARWGPEYTRFGQVYEGGNDDDLPPPKQVTLYLSPADEEIRRTIWHTIVSDARQARLNNY